MFRVGAAPSKFANSLSHHPSSPLSRTHALVKATKFALHLKKNVGMLPKEQNTLSRKQFELLSSAFFGCEDAIIDARGPESGELFMVPTLHTGERESGEKAPPGAEILFRGSKGGVSL